MSTAKKRAKKARQRLDVTASVVRELGNVWETEAVHVHVHGVDHTLLHAVASLLGAQTQPGFLWQDGRPYTLYVSTGAGDRSPRLYGLVNAACVECQRVTGAQAPQTAEAV